MAGYITTESITPFADARTLLCVAINQSSDPDHTRYSQKLVDVHSLDETPLGSLALVETLPPALVAGMPPTEYQQYQPIPSRLPTRMPTFAFGCPHATIIGMIFTVVYPYSLLRLVDAAHQRIIADYPLPHTYRAQFNRAGTRCLLAGLTNYQAFQIDECLVPLFTLDATTDADVAYQPMWCADRWCLFQRVQRAWFVIVLDEATGTIVNRIRLHGRPDSMQAAQTAPILACVLSRQRIQVINLDTRRSRIVRHPAPSTPSIPLGVAVSPDGRWIMARNPVDEYLWSIGAGDTMTHCMPLPRTEDALNSRDFMLSHPGFCVLNDRYLTMTRGMVTSHPHPLSVGS